MSACFGLRSERNLKLLGSLLLGSLLLGSLVGSCLVACCMFLPCRSMFWHGRTSRECFELPFTHFVPPFVRTRME